MARRVYSPAEKEAAVRAVLVDGGRSRDVAAALGMPVGTLRTWVRRADIQRRGQQWRELAGAHFDFLLEHGFAVTEVNAEDWWDIRVRYESSAAAVVVVLSFEFGRVEVFLAHARPAGPQPAHAAGQWFLDDLVALREPDGPAAPVGLDTPVVARALAYWADTLRRLGSDFVAGDLTVLAELDRIQQARIARHAAGSG